MLFGHTVGVPQSRYNVTPSIVRAATHPAPQRHAEFTPAWFPSPSGTDSRKRASSSTTVILPKWPCLRQLHALAPSTFVFGDRSTWMELVMIEGWRGMGCDRLPWALIWVEVLFEADSMPWCTRMRARTEWRRGIDKIVEAVKEGNSTSTMREEIVILIPWVGKDVYGDYGHVGCKWIPQKLLRTEADRKAAAKWRHNSIEFVKLWGAVALCLRSSPRLRAWVHMITV